MNKKLEYYKSKGYSVLNDQGDMVLLRRPKRFNIGAFLVLGLFFNIFGAGGYILYYMHKKYDERVVEKLMEGMK